MKKLLVGFTVLLVHTAAARAQQVPPAPAPAPAPPAEAPAPPAEVPAAPPAAPAQAYPPAYAPPPGYVPPAAAPAAPPPPPVSAAPAYGAPPPYGPPVYAPPPYRYGPPYRYAPPTYYAYPPSPPPRDVLYRPFTLGGGIGFGGLIYRDQNDNLNRLHQGGLSYTFRLGFGLCPGLLLLWDVEGAAVEHGASSLSQTANLVALQLFATRRLFVKGGFGLAAATQDNSTLWGAAAMGGLGYELVQGWNWSFDIEATITGAHINSNGTDQSWANWSLVNFALNFF